MHAKGSMLTFRLSSAMEASMSGQQIVSPCEVHQKHCMQAAGQACGASALLRPCMNRGLVHTEEPAEVRVTGAQSLPSSISVCLGACVPFCPSQAYRQLAFRRSTRASTAAHDAPAPSLQHLAFHGIFRKSRPCMNRGGDGASGLDSEMSQSPQARKFKVP